MRTICPDWESVNGEPPQISKGVGFAPPSNSNAEPVQTRVSHVDVVVVNVRKRPNTCPVCWSYPIPTGDPMGWLLTLTHWPPFQLQVSLSVGVGCGPYPSEGPGVIPTTNPWLASSVATSKLPPKPAGDPDACS